MGAQPVTGAPALVLVAHGSRATGGDDAAAAVATAVTARRPSQVVRLAYLSHGAPLLPDALSALAVEGLRQAVVVPLLLSTGVHSSVDIDRAVSTARHDHPQLAVTASGPLGPDLLLVAAVRERLGEAGIAPQPGTVVVLAATGSTVPDGAADVEQTAAMLQTVAAFDDVAAAYVGGGQPDLQPVIASARERGATTIAVVPYLLGDGHFAKVVRDVQQEGVVVTAPLGAHDGVVDLVLVRYDTTAAMLS
ncbi:MAG TPA: sirohydrochlorin chelatase [Mycobacteriales bacterium]|nr:sirohydrochlorin chelatase [Mycobacteriales bacterium]